MLTKRNDSEKAQFEVWAESRGYSLEWLNWRYPSIGTAAAWDGWLARAAHG